MPNVCFQSSYFLPFDSFVFYTGRIIVEPQQPQTSQYFRINIINFYYQVNKEFSHNGLFDPSPSTSQRYPIGSEASYIKEAP